MCNFPRANAGFKILPASMLPSPPPAPTMVWISSTNRMISPAASSTSLSTALRRSSNCPRNDAPATSDEISRLINRLFLSDAGTSFLMMRCAKASTMAVLPTPGSPISTGLFLVRRLRICMVRRISSSRPMTGSSLPSRASAVRSMPNCSSGFLLSSRCGPMMHLHF